MDIIAAISQAIAYHRAKTERRSGYARTPTQDATIFYERRIATPRRHTQELARQYGVSRQRINQIERDVEVIVKRNLKTITEKVSDDPSPHIIDDRIEFCDTTHSATTWTERYKQDKPRNRTRLGWRIPLCPLTWDTPNDISDYLRKDIFTGQEAARLLGISYHTLLNLLKANQDTLPQYTKSFEQSWSKESINIADAILKIEHPNAKRRNARIHT